MIAQSLRNCLRYKVKGKQNAKLIIAYANREKDDDKTKS